MPDISALRADNDPIRLGIYRHYKHTIKDPRYYLVLGLARSALDESIAVVYVPLYPAGGVRMAFRPLANFIENVILDAEVKPRFEFVGTEIPEYSV
jgi:hypothetical protein